MLTKLTAEQAEDLAAYLRRLMPPERLPLAVAAIDEALARGTSPSDPAERRAHREGIKRRSRSLRAIGRTAEQLRGLVPELEELPARSVDMDLDQFHKTLAELADHARLEADWYDVHARGTLGRPSDVWRDVVIATIHAVLPPDVPRERLIGAVDLVLGFVGRDRAEVTPSLVTGALRRCEIDSLTPLRFVIVRGSRPTS